MLESHTIAIAIAIGVVLFGLRRRGVRAGVLAITYFTAYAVSHFPLFYVRDSEPVVGVGLKQSQWTCLAMLVVGLPLLLLVWRRPPLAWAPVRPDPLRP